MATKTIKLSEIADPTIDKVFEEFLAEQRRRLKQKTYKRYEDVIELIQDHLNSYAFEGLSKNEVALFDKYFNAEGKEHREFCQLFGPEKIIENLGMFLNYYLIRKAMAGKDFLRTAGMVTKKLSQWLTDKGFVSGESAQEGMEAGAAATKDLPNAEQAA